MKKKKKSTRAQNDDSAPLHLIWIKLVAVTGYIQLKIHMFKSNISVSLEAMRLLVAYKPTVLNTEISKQGKKEKTAMNPMLVKCFRKNVISVNIIIDVIKILCSFHPWRSSCISRRPIYLIISAERKFNCGGSVILKKNILKTRSSEIIYISRSHSPPTSTLLLPSLRNNHVSLPG